MHGKPPKINPIEKISIYVNEEFPDYVQEYLKRSKHKGIQYVVMELLADMRREIADLKEAATQGKQPEEKPLDEIFKMGGETN